MSRFTKESNKKNKTASGPVICSLEVTPQIPQGENSQEHVPLAGNFAQSTKALSIKCCEDNRQICQESISAAGKCDENQRQGQIESVDSMKGLIDHECGKINMILAEVMITLEGTPTATQGILTLWVSILPLK